MTHIRHKVFGKDNHPTIYYLPGYGDGKQIKRYAPHIYTLVTAGYRVVAFEYNWFILQSGEPQTLISSLKTIEACIDKDKKGRTVAGVYGASLGSWLGANVLKDCDIQRGIFNSGGARLSSAIWNAPSAWKERHAYEDKGYGQAEVQKYWKRYEPAEPGFLKNKRLLVMNSARDKVFNIDESRSVIAAWQAAGNDVSHIETVGLSHAKGIGRNMLRTRTVAKFFAHSLK